MELFNSYSVSTPAVSEVYHRTEGILHDTTTWNTTHIAPKLNVDQKMLQDQDRVITAI